MADNTVYIAGVADGAFEKALGELPGWATEKVAKNIEKILEDSLGIQRQMLSEAIKCCKGAGGGAGNIPTEEMGKVKGALDDLLKSLDHVTKANKDIAADAAAKKKVADDEKDQSAKTKVMSYLGNKALGGLVAMGGKLVGIQKQYYDTSNDLFKSGINLLNGNDTTTSSFISLQQMITLAGVRLEVFEKAVMKYSSSVNAVGVKKFASTINLAGKELAELGFKSNEWGEIVGAMMESESAYSDLRGKSDEELAANAKRYGAQLKNLAFLTGQSIDKLKESSIEVSRNSDMMAVEAEWGEAGAARIKELASALPGASEAIVALASSSSQANEEMYQTLVKAGAGPQADRFRNTITELANGTISTETAIRQMGDTAKEFDKGQIAALRLQKTAGTQGAKISQDFIFGLRKVAYTTSDASKAQADAATKSQSSISKFSTAAEELAAEPQRAFVLLESQLDAATAGLIKMNEAVNSLIKTTSLETRSQIGIGLEIASAVLGLAVATGILKNVAKGFGGLIGAGKGGPVGPSGPTPPGGKGAGKWAGRAAKGAKGGIVGVATGIALDAASESLEESGHTTAAAATDIASSAATMAGTGALLGSFIPIIGTGIGALVGALAGAGYGTYQNWDKLTSSTSKDEKTKPKEGAPTPTPTLKIKTEGVSAPPAKIDAKTTQISVPTTPALSTVNSPAAITPEGDPKAKRPTVPETAESIMGPVMDKPDGNKDINTVLRHSSDVLEAILLASNQLVEVNKDILKYSRISA